MLYETSNPEYGIFVDCSGNAESYIVTNYRTGEEIPVGFNSLNDALEFAERIH